MIRLLALLLLLTAVASTVARPNIVLIMSDDVGYSDIGCYGGEIKTPNLDGLASNGLRFTQFYNTGRCCPTRASLLTGLYPHQTGVGHMMRQSRGPGRQPLKSYQGDLNRRCVTIAEALGGAGYRTYMAGKWHLTRHFDSPDASNHNWPRQRGFDRFYGTIMGGGNFYDPAALCRDNTWVTPYTDTAYRPWGDRRPEPDEFYYTDAVSDNAVTFMQEHESQHPEEPFFLYVAYTAAHWPMHALPEDVAKYRGVYDVGYEAVRRARYDRMQSRGVLPPGCELSATVGEWDDLGERRDFEVRCMEVYAAMLDRMDQGIGKIVGELERQGRLDDTLILYLQDNGGCAERVGRKPNQKWLQAAGQPLPDDHYFARSGPPLRDRTTGRALQGYPAMPGPRDTFVAYGEAWANVSNTPFRMYKHYVHEGGIATPLVAHWPAGFAGRGDTRSQPAHLIDILPTCLDLAGVDYPQQFAGEAVLPAEGTSLRNAFADKPLERDTIYWEHEGNCAVRTADWKLVRLLGKPWELYDLTADRSELNDLSSVEPDRAAAMAADWQAWAARVGVFPSPFIK